MIWAKRQMRSLTENLGDLAGHDIVTARHAERHSAERPVAPPRYGGWIIATARWLRRFLAMAPGDGEPSCPAMPPEPAPSITRQRDPLRKPLAAFRCRAPTSKAPLIDGLERRAFILIPVGSCSLFSIV